MATACPLSLSLSLSLSLCSYCSPALLAHTLLSSAHYSLRARLFRPTRREKGKSIIGGKENRGGCVELVARRRQGGKGPLYSRLTEFGLVGNSIVRRGRARRS